MKNRIRIPAATAIVVALVSLASLLDAGVVRAQACTGLRVVNTLGCAVNLCLVDPAGAVICHPVPAGATVNFPLPVTFVIAGVRSAAGNIYPFPPQPPSPACTPCIDLPSPVVPGCCGVVCYDAPHCLIRIVQCQPIGPCLP